MNQTIYHGFGSHNRLSGILEEKAPDKIFLVTGKESFSLSGAQRTLEPILTGYEVFRFFDFHSNPEIEDIRRGIEQFKKSECDFILCAGGGSAIDTAKAVSILVENKDDPERIINEGIPLRPRRSPLVILPSTSGTGSESTHFSVIYICKKKYSLAHPSMIPDIAILDPALTESMPPYITACTGMDALCQGIESFWSVNSTEESRQYSGQAVLSALEYIVKAVNAPDKKSRENMLMAANLSGRAINIAKTTASHAASYPLTSYYNIPHGHAVALILPPLIEFNNDVSVETLQDKRGIEFVEKIMDELFEILNVPDAGTAKEKIINIMENIGLETRLSGLGINKDQIDNIVENGFNPRITNNPRHLMEKDLRGLIEKMI